MTRTEATQTIPTLTMGDEIFQLEVFGADIQAVRTINRREPDLILIGGGTELREFCTRDFNGFVGNMMEAEYIKQEIKGYCQKNWMYFLDLPE